MAIEREPASHARTGLWLLGLLGILSVSTFLTSKRNHSNKAIYPQDTTDHEDARIPIAPAAIQQNVIPPVNGKKEPDATHWWEKVAALAQIIAAPFALGLLLINICQMRATQKSADTADKTMKLAYRPRVIINNLGYSTTPGFPTFFDKEGKIEMSMGYSNLGTIMAKNVHYFIFWGTCSRQERSDKIELQRNEWFVRIPKDNPAETHQSRICNFLHWTVQR